jgi:hypothetical protein
VFLSNGEIARDNAEKITDLCRNLAQGAVPPMPKPIADDLGDQLYIETSKLFDFIGCFGYIWSSHIP